MKPHEPNHLAFLIKLRTYPNQRVRRCIRASDRTTVRGPLLTPRQARRLQPRWARMGFEAAWIGQWERTL